METEEKNNTQDPQSPQDQPTTAPIIDVQPPQQDIGSGPASQNQADAVAPSFSSPTEPSSQPASMAEPSEQKKPTDSPGIPQAPDPVKQPELTAPKKHGAPLLVIGVAIVVAAILAVFTIFAFSKQDKESPKPSAGLNETQQPAVEQVTPQTVDNTSREVDEAIQSVDEAADFSEDELSDRALGL